MSNVIDRLNGYKGYQKSLDKHFVSRGVLNTEIDHCDTDSLQSFRMECYIEIQSSYMMDDNYIIQSWLSPE